MFGWRYGLCVMPTSSWFSPVLQALANGGVDYVLVGGLATIAHGYLRTTQDIDLIVELTEDNALRAVLTLEKIGYRPRVPEPAVRFADAAARRMWRDEKNMMVFTMIHESPKRPVVDLFIDYPLPWKQLRDAAVERTVAGVVVPVCSIDDLITIKEAAGRDRDLVDIAKLRQVRDNPNQV